MAGNVKTVTIEIDVKTGSITKGREEFDKLNSTVNKGSKDMTNNMSKLSTSIVGIGTAMVGAFAIKAIVGNAIKSIVEFDQSMADLSSITGATGKNLEKLKNEVIKTSQATGKSANDIAKAFSIVGSAKPDLLKSAAALGEVTKQAVILSQAGMMEVPEAAASLTLAMNQFGASAADAAKYTDILATSQQLGTATIAQLAESLKNVGAVAASAGVSFEDTNVALQAMAAGGLVGAEAGTGLRAVILKLQAAGIGFVDGQFNLQEAIKQTKEKFEGIQDPIERVKAGTKLFGEENIKTGNTLIAQIGIIDNLTGALNVNGAALDQAAVRMDTIAGRNEKMASAYDRFILSIADGKGEIGGLVKTLQEFVTSIFETSELDEKISKLGMSGRGLFQDFDLATEGVIAFSNALEKQITNFSLSNPSIAEQAAKMKDLKKAMDGTNRSTEEGNAKFLLLQQAFYGLNDSLKESVKASKTVKTTTDEEAAAALLASEATKEGAKSTEDAKASKERLAAAAKAEAEAIKEAADAAKEHADIINEIIKAENEHEDNKLSQIDREKNAVYDKYFSLIEAAKQHGVDTAELEIAQREAINAIDEEDKQVKLDADFADKEKRLEFEQEFADRKKDLDNQIKLSALGLAAALANATGGGMAAQMAALAFDKGAAIASIIMNNAKANLAATAAYAAIPFVGEAMAASIISKNNTLAGISIATVAATAIPQAIQITQPKKYKDGVIDLQGKGTATSDSIPAMLSKGESVMTAKETQEYKPVLKAMREGTFDDYINRVIVQQLYTHKTKERVKVKEVKQAQINFPKGFKVTNAKDISRPLLDAMEESKFLNQNSSWR